LFQVAAVILRALVVLDKVVLMEPRMIVLQSVVPIKAITFHVQLTHVAVHLKVHVALAKIAQL
jgi:predicted DNA-binding ArsR family transcriptional regulator